MPIKLSHTEAVKSEHTTLAEIREGILAAAREAEAAGRHDKLDILLTDTKYTLDAPFVLSAVENPELHSVDITFRAKYPGETQISSLVRMDGKKFVKAEGKKYFI